MKDIKKLRFINRDFSSNSFDSAHEKSCKTMGDAQEIIKRHQFIHFELEGFWRDSERWQWVSDAIKNFFPSL